MKFKFPKWVTLRFHGGGHELFKLARSDMFPVVRHFVQFPVFLTGRKPAPILKCVSGIGTFYAHLSSFVSCFHVS